MEASEVKLSYRSKVKASERPKISCSQDIYKLVMNTMFDDDTIEHRESLKVLLLNRAHKVLGFHTASIGGTAGCTADIKIILQAAILSNSNAIVLCHNHPSGNLQPSLEDDRLTQKISNACKVMDISFLDHLIVTTEHYYSYADEGRI